MLQLACIQWVWAVDCSRLCLPKSSYLTLLAFSPNCTLGQQHVRQPMWAGTRRWMVVNQQWHIIRGEGQ